MKDAQKPNRVGLDSLINWMSDGRFIIPDFQREFEWNPWDIRDLMRSIFSDYYIGSLLLWEAKNGNFEHLECEELYGHSGEGSAEYIVLDGQQRLAAMHYAFLAPEKLLPKRKKRALYYIDVDKFMSDETDEAFIYEWLSTKTQSLPENDFTRFEEHMFPLSILGRGARDSGVLFKWFSDYTEFWRQKAENASNEDERSIALKHARDADDFRGKILEVFYKYQISYIELNGEIGIEKICDIFTQINSKGMRLDIFDLLNALMRKDDIKLKDMYRAISDRLSFVDNPNMNIYILQVMSILLQNYCSPKYLYFLRPGVKKPVRLSDGTSGQKVLVSNREDFVARWEEAVNALKRAIGLLSDPRGYYGAVRPDYIPYVSIMPAFAAINKLVDNGPRNKQLAARRKVRLWYWASVFLKRYSSAAETTAARDFVDMRGWLENEDAKPPMIDEFAQSYRNLDLHSEVKRASSIYSAIFNLFVLAGARDWKTGYVPDHGDFDAHHIVPSSWEGKNETPSDIDSILNKSLLTSDTNRNFIRKRMPNEYLQELIDKNDRAAVIEILEPHFISEKALDILLRNPFTANDYEEFLSERRRTLIDGIGNLLIKRSLNLDLAPNLRDLDSRIGGVELGLRAIVVSAVGNDPKSLPSHLLDKVRRLIQTALRQNASLDPEKYDQTDGILEYFDLREVEQTLLSKALWEKFSDRFKSKETLAQKFKQLPELRNGIRHSRTVDGITRKEGEAALDWFEEVLSKRSHTPPPPLPGLHKEKSSERI